MIDVMRDMWREIAIAVAVAATITAVLVLLWLRWSASSAPQKHYALAKLRLRRLPAKSPTRLRIEAAQRAFTKGWKALGGSDPYTCLTWFARAVEIDELGCGWHKSYEGKVDKVGDFFTMPPKDDLDKYESMLAEAYLVVLLHTVVSDGGGATGGGVGGGQGEQDLEEDYRVVRTRLDVCVSLQPDNPAVYKMRADMLQRFGHLASKQELVADFEQAIRLAEDDDSGKRLRCDGVDPKQQRAFLIAYCAHQLGGLQHRLKETDAAYEAYKKAVKYADPAFVNLADAHFSLCILAIMRARRAEHVDRPAGMLEAMQHYKQGLKAEKEALKYLPHVQTNVSKNLAKELLKRFAKS